MKTQNYSNHRQMVPTYHYLTYGGVAGALGCAIVYCCTSEEDVRLLSFTILLVILTLASTVFHTRLFALKAQDRAIRAEENLRYFILTGKRMDQSLSLKQIVALRFASDEELAALTERAVKEKLSPDEIKKAVRNWRGDYKRV